MGETRASTILDLIRRRAADSPGATAFHFLGRGDWTWGSFWNDIDSNSRTLQRSGIAPGDPVLMAIPNSPEFLIVFFAVQRAGGIPVPLFPDTGKQRASRLARICGAEFMVTLQSENNRIGTEPSPLSVNRVPGTNQTGVPHKGSPHFPDPAEIALVQFTSGSTGFPAGALIRHKALEINIRQMVSAMAITSRDVFVNWLPVYHDMGLILMTLTPLVVGCRLTIMPSGLRRIPQWFSLIERQRGTFIAAPDFVYRLAPALIRNHEAVDISSLRVALNAAEPVRSTTIRDFESRFGLTRVMMPAYGLAEATVGVSCRPPGASILVDPRGNVCVGGPFTGIEIRIREPDGSGVGEIQVLTPAASAGYCGSSGDSEKLFDEDGWIRTGDLGYMDEKGNLFVVGRIKNSIRQEGRSLGAREVEERMDMLPFVRRSAALGLDRGGAEGEQVLVCLEVRLPTRDREEQSRAAITAVRSFKEYFGFRPGRIVLLAPGAIPHTSNGKTRYSELKRLFLTRQLPVLPLLPSDS